MYLYLDQGAQFCWICPQSSARSIKNQVIPIQWKTKRATKYQCFLVSQGYETTRKEQAGQVSMIHSKHHCVLCIHILQDARLVSGIEGTSERLPSDNTIWKPRLCNSSNPLQCAIITKEVVLSRTSSPNQLQLQMQRRCWWLSRVRKNPICRNAYQVCQPWTASNRPKVELRVHTILPQHTKPDCFCKLQGRARVKSTELLSEQEIIEVRLLKPWLNHFTVEFWMKLAD